jgi:WD40 repeat protein
MDIATHGSDHVIAASLITGHVVLHRYNPAAPATQTLTPHPDSARCVQFAAGGRLLFSASVHRDIAATDLATGAVAARISDAHASGVNALHIFNENCVISGDDDGEIKVWDVRTGASVMSASSHEDFISSFVVGPDGNSILSGSGDGMLGVHCMRTGKLQAMSDNMEAEVLSLCLLKHGRKVAAGLQDGVIAIFSWGDWGDCTDRWHQPLPHHAPAPCTHSRLSDSPATPRASTLLSPSTPTWRAPAAATGWCVSLTSIPTLWSACWGSTAIFLWNACACSLPSPHLCLLPAHIPMSQDV